MSFSQASEKNTKPHLKTHERGYLFDGLDENQTSNPQLSQKMLLAQLIKIAKEQLKVQKKILEEVKQIRKPKAETIVVNGKECIANSSAECFQMPLTPTAQKIPVYKNWLRNPNEKNSLALIQWESKYFNGISRSAHSKDFTITKYGDKALKTSFNRSNFDSIGGEHRVVREKNREYLLNKIGKDTFEMYLYFGKNAEMDYQSFHNYYQTVDKLKKVSYTIIFYTTGAHEAFKDSSKVFPEIKRLLKGAKTIKFGKSFFKKANIYTTPTLAIKLKNSDEILPISVGNYFSRGLHARIMKMLVLKKVVKPEHSPDYKMFERVGKSGTDFVNRYYEKKLNMKTIKALYKKDNKK